MSRFLTGKPIPVPARDEQRRSAFYNAGCVSTNNQTGERMARPCRIVVIEDNEPVLKLLSEHIEVEGYDVEMVHPPLDDADKIDFEEFDLAFIDLTLPHGLDPLELARRATVAGTGVILMSGDHAQLEDVADAGHALLKKPFRMAILTRLIKDVLSQVGAECEAPPRAASA